MWTGRSAFSSALSGRHCSATALGARQESRRSPRSAGEAAHGARDAAPIATAAIVAAATAAIRPPVLIRRPPKQDHTPESGRRARALPRVLASRAPPEIVSAPHGPLRPRFDSRRRAARAPCPLAGGVPPPGRGTGARPPR